MLAELAAANAAFAVIKATLKNGKELADAGSSLVDYFRHKDSLQKTVNDKKSSKKPRLFGDTADPLEEFLNQEQALTSLHRQEQELRELMVYHGRPGLWDDWLQFQAEYRRKQREEKAAIERQKLIRRQKLEQRAEIALAILLTLVAGVGISALIIKIFSS